MFVVKLKQVIEVSELKKIISDANIKLLDIDSIIEVPSFHGLALSKHFLGQEMLDQQKRERQFETFLAKKDVFLEFELDVEQTELFIARHLVEIPSPKALKQKLLILENFHYLGRALTTVDLYRYSNSFLYAALCISKERKQNQEIPNGILTILNTPRVIGYTKELLLEKYPLTEEKMKLMEKIHDVKKAARHKSGRISK